MKTKFNIDEDEIVKTSQDNTDTETPEESSPWYYNSYWNAEETPEAIKNMCKM